MRTIVLLEWYAVGRSSNAQVILSYAVLEVFWTVPEFHILIVDPKIRLLCYQGSYVLRKSLIAIFIQVLEL